jgi:hypothetical protein
MTKDFQFKAGESLNHRVLSQAEQELVREGLRKKWGDWYGGARKDGKGGWLQSGWYSDSESTKAVIQNNLNRSKLKVKAGSD